MSTFGERLKSVRLSAGLSQEQLGVQAGIEEASASARMNRYEKGTRAAAVEIVRQIAHVLKVPVSYFFSENDDEAELLLAFHRMSAEQRREVLQFVHSASTK
jgi:transcriptional regulator with XRE-family HTH domain